MFWKGYWVYGVLFRVSRLLYRHLSMLWIWKLSVLAMWCKPIKTFRSERPPVWPTAEAHCRPSATAIDCFTYSGIRSKYFILYLKHCLWVPSHYQYWLQMIDIHRANSQKICKIWWQKVFLCTCQWSMSYLASPVLLGSQWVNLCLRSLMSACMTGQLKQLSADKRQPAH